MKSSSTNNITVKLNNLKMYFPTYKGLSRKHVSDIKAVDGVNFTIKSNETLGLVGESGCGKSTTGRCILRLYRPTGGQIFFEGHDITQLPENKLKPMRCKMQYIFQDPYSSLNPRQSVGNLVGEPLKVHNLTCNYNEYQQRIKELFSEVELDFALANRLPHELSGGQRQRVAIARALSCKPSFVVCDEPVSALDVSIQAQIMNLLVDLKEKQGLTYLFISHNLSVVRYISDWVAVMYLGRIIEIASQDEIFENPLHPYTRALLSSVPIPDPFIEEKRERIIIKGDVPSITSLPVGCVFHPRCLEAGKECSEAAPVLKDKGNNHEVACLKL